MNGDADVSRGVIGAHAGHHAAHGTARLDEEGYRDEESEHPLRHGYGASKAGTWLRLLGTAGAGFRVHLPLCPIDAAPVLVLGDRHPAFHTDPDPSLRLSLLREQLLEDRHGH